MQNLIHQREYFYFTFICEAFQESDFAKYRSRHKLHMDYMNTTQNKGGKIMVMEYKAKKLILTKLCSHWVMTKVWMVGFWRGSF